MGRLSSYVSKANVFAWAACLAALITLTVDGQAQVRKVIDSRGDGAGGDLFRVAAGLAVSDDGTTYVAGRVSNNIFAITPNGEIREILRTAGDLALDPRDGALVVAVGLFGVEPVVLRVAPSGETHVLLDRSGDGRGTELELPVRPTFGPDGSLYLADFTGDTVFRITAAGDIDVLIDASGDGEHPLEEPSDVAVSGDGVVYVVGRRSNNVFAITPDGQVTQIADAEGDGDGNELLLPRSVCVDSRGYVYVSAWQTSDGFVFRISPEGVVKVVLDSAGDGVTPFRCPAFMAVDAADNVYVPGQCSENVFRIGPSGEVAEVVPTGGAGPGSELEHPSLLAVTPSGTVVVASNPGQNNVLRRSTTGEITEILTQRGDGEDTGFGGGDENRTLVAFGPEGEMLFFGRSLFRAEVGEDPVLVATPSLDSATYNGTEAEWLELLVSNDGSLYVSDNLYAGLLSQVLRVDSDGTVATVVDWSTLGPALFNHAVDIALDGDGNLYASGRSSSSAVRVGADGTVTVLIDGTGDGDGAVLEFAQGLAVDATGNVYVGGTFSHNVFRISASGEITEILDATGDGLGNELSEPWGIAVDGAQNVYVTSRANDRVFRVSPSGVVDVILTAEGDGENPLGEPFEVVVGLRGEVYVAGAESDNVFRIDVDGSVEEIVGPEGNGALEPLDGPSDLAVDPRTGNLLIAGGISDNAFLYEVDTCEVLPLVEFRDGGANPPSYTASPASVGGTVHLRVNLETTGHVMTRVLGFDSPVDLALEGGQTLLIQDLAGFGALLDTGLHPGPLADIEVPVPNVPLLAGVTLHTQALHVGGVLPFALSNAQTIVLGSCR